MINPPKTLKTDRLRLRKVKLADADAIFRQYAQDPEVTKYVSWRAHRDIEETREYVRMCLLAWDVGKAFHWAIERREMGAGLRARTRLLGTGLHDRGAQGAD